MKHLAVMGHHEDGYIAVIRLYDAMLIDDEGGELLDIESFELLIKRERGPTYDYRPPMAKPSGKRSIIFKIAGCSRVHKVSNSGDAEEHW